MEEIKELIDNGTLGPERNAVLISNAKVDNIPNLIEDAKVNSK